MSGILAKDRFLFDPADLSESDQIGAYLRAGSDGDLLSSTNVGGKEGLDVNLINASVVVSATDLDIRDLTHASDSVKVGDGTDFLAVNNDGSINAVVSATDLDIRDLAFATDKVDVTGSEVSLDAATLAALENISVTIDGVADDAADGGADVLKVGGVAQSQAAALDLADAGDRVQATFSLARHLLVSDHATQSVLSSAVTVGATAVALPASSIPNRKELQIQNVSNNDIWIGASDVTSSNGIRVSKGSFYSAKVGEGVVLYAIAAGAGNDVRVIQYA